MNQKKNSYYIEAIRDIDNQYCHWRLNDYKEATNRLNELMNDHTLRVTRVIYGRELDIKQTNTYTLE